MKVAWMTASIVTAVVLTSGCDKKEPSAKPQAPAPVAAHDADTEHAHGDAHAHGHDHPPDAQAPDDHFRPATTPLGTQTVAGFSVNASYDGEIVAGKELPVDAAVTAPATGSKVTAVRFWVGAPDAKGSVKSAGELKDGRYRCRVGVPKTALEGSKLWIEIETDSGDKVTGGFAVKV